MTTNDLEKYNRSSVAVEVVAEENYNFVGNICQIYQDTGPVADTTWSLKILRNEMIRYRPYNFLLSFHAIFNHIFYRFREIPRVVRYWLKTAKNVLPSVHITPPHSGLLQSWITPDELKKLQSNGATRMRKKPDDIFSPFDTMLKCDRQTDRQTVANG